ncbi:MAG: aldehyde ferredoxin oxidoreductase family protein [Deltaproteobacteria bacterium]|nr:aldehyde ferredoxin oxidoreductase family protein [Deltaproteobacteria bacterium]
MKLKGGYFKKLLFIDLDKGKAEVLKLSDEFCQKYIGGRGFGIKLVWDNMKNYSSPFDPQNLIVVAPGPLTGLYLPSSGKTSFISISPATGIYGDSSMGGSFGVELRQAGYDALAIKGKAQNISYLWIDDDEVEVVEHEGLKGKGSLEAEGMLKKELKDNHLSIATIGIAGENLVRFACINADWGRNAGRTGLGAVLGSKNIKAIVVRGSKDLPVYDLKRLKEVSDDAFEKIKSHKYFEFWQQQGLMSVIDYANEAGIMPTYNFRDGRFEQAEKVNGYEMQARYKIGDTACFACPMACGNICLVKEGKYSGTVIEGPEYETACMFGPNLGVDNFACILKANALCDDLGVDTISTGNLIGVLIEGQEAGLISEEELGGMRLKWGDEDTIIQLIHDIANRKGIGDVLADGSLGLLKKMPQLSPILSQVKGLEQSAYDARAAISMALGFATSDIGAHHTRAWPLAKELELGKDWGLEQKAELVIYHQTVRPLFDMLGVCRLPWIELGFDENTYADFYSAVTGISLNLDELLKKSNDLYNLTRAINIKLGMGKKDDYPPERCFSTPIASGPQAGKVIDKEEYEKILAIYYQKRGWSEDGQPDTKSISKKFSDNI